MYGEIAGYGEAAQAGSVLAWVQLLILLAVTVYFLVCSVLLWRIDLAEHRLPDKIVLPMYAVIGVGLFVVLWIDQDTDRMRQVAYSSVFLGGLYWVLRLVSRQSIGLGDVKLAGVIGLICGFFSPFNILWATFIAFLLGGFASLLLLLSRRARAGTHIAFGPFMIGGALIALFFPV